MGFFFAEHFGKLGILWGDSGDLAVRGSSDYRPSEEDLLGSDWSWFVLLAGDESCFGCVRCAEYDG